MLRKTHLQVVGPAETDPRLQETESDALTRVAEAIGRELSHPGLSTGWLCALRSAQSHLIACAGPPACAGPRAESPPQTPQQARQ